MAACSSSSPSPALSSHTAEGLDLDFAYELIPDCPAATAAGYTPADREKAQTWFAPVADKTHFWYAAWRGAVLGTTDHLSSILVCRTRATGALVWATNCRDYSLDTAPNFLGDSAVICRAHIFLLGGSLYLCNAIMSNIGPQVFCVNKKSGALRWACGYYPPSGLGPLVTDRGNYSAYTGSNMRVSDLCPSGGCYQVQGQTRKILAVGTSSLQNAANVGVIQGGFPVYTDQGFLFLLEDLGSRVRILGRTPTCAPILSAGDVVIKGGDPIYDPFPPGSEAVTILSQSTPENLLLQPYFLTPSQASPPAQPGTCPVTALVTFTAATLIDPSLVQPLWSLPGILIYQDSTGSEGLSLDQLLDLWREEQAQLPPGATARHTIFSYFTPDQIQEGQTQLQNLNLVYFKSVQSGYQILTPFEAQNFNYWGNGTWGGAPQFFCKEGHLLVAFGTGQAHDIILDESLTLSQPRYNFLDLKKPVIDVMVRYSQGQASLDTVNRSKAQFLAQVQTAALDLELKSPRGRMSYSDALLVAQVFGGTSEPGQLVGGSRILAWDTYSFLSSEPHLLLYPYSNAIDGDASSGPQLYEDACASKIWISTVAKSGVGITLDLSGLRVKKAYNHENLEEMGIRVLPLVFGGPNGILGGSNYECGSWEGRVFANQGNMSWNGGSRGTDGVLEFEVTPEGRVLPTNNSFVQGYDFPTGKIAWTTPLDNRSHSQVVGYEDLALAGDGVGSYYAISGCTGQILWKWDATSQGVRGGILAPTVTGDGRQLLWPNSYVAFGAVGQTGRVGVVLKVNPLLLITESDKYSRLLQGRTFVSWDTYPKLTFPNPAVAPVNNVVITHQWLARGVLEAVHQTLIPPSVATYTFRVESYEPGAKRITFRLEEGEVVYVRVRLINKKTYKLVYRNQGVSSTAWLKAT